MKLYNIVKVYTSTTGIGTVTLGSAVPSFLTFSGAGVINGSTVSYAIEDGNQREVGTGVYDSGTQTLTRNVITSTNSNSAIPLSGAGVVFITGIASDLVTGAADLSTVGAIPYVSASGILNQDPTALFWDAANDRLGVGTNAPSAGYRQTIVAPDSGFGTALYLRNNNLSQALSLGWSGISATSNLSFGAGTATNNMTIATSGNILIGTATDSNFKLDVAASGSAGTARFYGGAGVSDTTKVVVRAGAGQSGNLQEWTGSNGTTVHHYLNNDEFYFKSYQMLLQASYVGAIKLNSASTMGWANGIPATNALDLSLSRASAGVLQVGDGGANALGSITAATFTGSLTGNASTATALAGTLASGAILKGQGTGIPAASIMSESAITSTYDSTARTVAAITDGGLARVIKSRPSTESKRIVIYGSSVAAGSGASTYANSWAGIFSTAMTAKGYTVYNPSIGGNSTAALISRFWTDVAPVSPDFVILASGFPNDGYDQTTYLANMHRLIKMVESIGAIPVIFGQYGDNTVDATILRKKQEIYAYFDKTGLLIADMFGSVADPATGYWLTGVYADSLHPNDTGHAIMAANIPYTWFDNALTARYAHRSKTASFLTLSNTSTTQSPILVTLDRPAPSWTVAGWFKDGGTVGRAYFGVTNSEGNAVRARNASGLIDFAGAPGVLISSSVNGQGGEWHHIAVTYQGNTKTNSLYVDGALIGTVVGGSTAVTATAFAFLGRSDTNTLNMIGGSIAMPLVYRAALTANDIKQIYSGSIPIRSLEWASSLSQLPTAGMIRNEADTSVSGIVASAADWTGPVPFITDRALGKAAAFGLAVYDQGTIGISQITVRPGANQSTNPTMAWLNSGGTTVSSVDSNGYANFARLGVGITPTNPLHIYSAPGSDTNAYFEGNGAYLKLNGRIGYSHVEFQNNGTATWKIGQEGVTKLQFFNGGVEKASIATDGTITAPGFTGALTGNASTATALASTVASGRIWYGNGTGAPGSDSGLTFTAPANKQLDLSSSFGAFYNATSASGNSARVKLSQTGIVNWNLENTATSGLFSIYNDSATAFAINASSRNVMLGTTTDLGYGLHAANKGTNGNLLVFDPTATTGTSKALFVAGQGQSGNILEVRGYNATPGSGTLLAGINSNGTIFNGNNLGGGLVSNGFGFQNGSGSFYGIWSYETTRNAMYTGDAMAIGLQSSGAKLAWYSGTVGASAFDLSLSRASAGVLQVGDGGANANGYLSAARIGVGTTNPINTLHVARNTSNQGGIYLENTSTGTNELSIYSANWPSGGNYSMGLDSTGGYLYVGPNAPLRFFNSGTERARFAATTGNFLIGTTTDDGSNKLQIVGAYQAAFFAASGSNNNFTKIDSVAGARFYQTNASGTVVNLIQSSSSASYFNAGNVLIGTTTDSNFKLDVAASGSAGTARFYGGSGVSNSTKVVVQAGGGQSGNLQEWQNSAGTVLASINNSGQLTLGSGLYLPDGYGVSWYDGTANIGGAGNGTTSDYLSFTTNGTLALRINGSQILQFGGTTSSFPALKRSSAQIHVRLADDSAYAGVRAASYSFVSGSMLTDASDGIIQLTNAAGSNFDRLVFGIGTSAFPSWKRSSAILQARLADDSANTQIQASRFISDQTTPAASTDAGTAGAIWADANYIYVQTAAGTIKRVALTTF